MAAIAFFPWLDCDRPMSFGPARLLPYSRGKLPGSQSTVPQASIDIVLSAYADRPRKQIRNAALLEVDDWCCGDDIDDRVISRLFLAKEALLFAALANRRLFSFHNYCNADNFQLVVQRFSPDRPEGLAYNTRRRDGGTGSYWSSKEFAFVIPTHVYRERIDFDETIAELVMRLETIGWIDAIAEFNTANSDSSAIPTYIEMIMIKSAFERLLDIDNQAVSFANALQGAISLVPLSPPQSGALTETWRTARPKSPTLLDAWAREFCAIRGLAAHGMGRTQRSFVWSEAAHLAFASMLFPLVFKALAHSAGEYSLNEDDRARISLLESFIVHDPFQPTVSVSDRVKHPWFLIDSELDLRRIARRLYAPSLPE